MFFFNSASTVTLIINSHKIGWVRICGQVAELVIGDINGRTEPGEIVKKCIHFYCRGSCYPIFHLVLSDFINLTQVHNFKVSAQDIFTFRRLSVFTVSLTRILQVLMQIMKRFALYY